CARGFYDYDGGYYFDYW
nr:immunoglobulin heavy chain junction region [Mus musculus]